MKAQEEAWLAEEAWLEAERQEQAWLKEEKACAEAEAQRLEAVHKAEEARKAEESQQVDALVGGLTGAGSNMEVMNPQCLHCAWTNTVCLHNTDSKKKCMACNQCNELKEHCWWLVNCEIGPGAGPVMDKGKRKVEVLKGADNKGDDVGKGPLMRRTSVTRVTSTEVETSLVTGAQMECLIKAVKCVTDNVASLVVAQREVSRNFYWFTQSSETYIKKCFEFLALDMPSDQDTTNEEDRGIKGLDDELEELREEEESWSWSESGDQTGAGSAGSQV
ncbi:hypothetical protein M404DRAFT_30931 [Pisolithus tinctorius Marx 270]|uniref:Uncharacterized protein n=1 Tax=Pisolithus tinctorius Marx 270 TaxID=870435 RepID=A0A0C3NU55_PISTI|nr:hypothetical protein M404DRAFT_30931 [Pisolithus tinctorius Marx 270]